MMGSWGSNLMLLLLLLLTSASVQPLSLFGTVGPLQRTSNHPSATISYSSSFVSIRGCILRQEENDGESNTRRTSNRSSCLEMAKGDGKSKRIKKSKNSNKESASSSSNTPPPLRVTNQINIPVRQQILWAKRNKEIMRRSTPGYRKPKVVRTKFRMTYSEEELDLKRKERANRGKEPDWDEILRRPSQPTILMVDGYNVIFQWKELRRYMMDDDAQEARKWLVRELKGLSLINGWRIEVVFDGHKRSLIGPAGQASREPPKPTREDRATTKYKEKDGVSVVYTGVGKEADSYIMERCFFAKHYNGTDKIPGGASNFIVATNDNIVRMAAMGAGAACMSSDTLIAELEGARLFYKYQHEKFQEAQPEFDSDVVLQLRINGTMTSMSYGSLQGKQLVTDELGITYIEDAPKGQNDPLKYYKSKK